MSHITKLLQSPNGGSNRSIVALLSILVLPLMAAAIAQPAKASALSLTDITNGLNKTLTMGKSTPAPIYTPAPSNAPSSATSPVTPTTAAPTASAPQATITSQKVANTSTVSDSPTKYSGNEASNQPNLYKVTQLTAHQSQLAQNIMRTTLTTGILLILVALIVFGLQFSRARNHIDQSPLRKQSEAKA